LPAFNSTHSLAFKQTFCKHNALCNCCWPADLPAPEPLTPADAKDAQPLLDLLGDYTVRAMFSKSWQLREAALQASMEARWYCVLGL
jgi:hypothetical protein